MFGRRNPDLPPSALPPTPSEDDLNLDLLPDIPDLPPAESRESASPAPPAPPVPPGDPAWYASAPVAPSPPLSPAITQRLPVQTEPPAPPPTSPAAIAEPQSAAQTPPSPLTPAFALPAALVPAPSPTPAPAPPTSPTLSIGALLKNAGAPQPQAAAESVIGPEDFFDGRYRSERGVRIQGNARGSIESRQYIFIEAGAVVEADLSAEDITVAGSISGTIECRRRLEVMGTGKVQGHVQSTLLVVQEGGMLDGELHMRAADARPAESHNAAPEPQT